MSPVRTLLHAGRSSATGFGPSRRSLLAALVLSGCAAAIGGRRADADDPSPPPDLPAGWRLLLHEDFSAPAVPGRLVATDPTAWRLATVRGAPCLEQFKGSAYQPPHRSPLNRVFLGDVRFGDFVLEASLEQTSKDYGHRDMCLFFGFQDPAHFYYVHIATKSDPHAHQIFIVDDAPRKAISTSTTSGAEWGRDEWKRVRLERRLQEGTIRVWFDGAAEPIMTATDKRLGTGWIGLGSFDDTGRVASVSLWGPEGSMQPARLEAFPRLAP